MINYSSKTASTAFIILQMAFGSISARAPKYLHEHVSIKSHPGNSEFI